MIGQELKGLISRLWPILLVLVVLPALSFGFWWFSPEKTLEILVLDKTVINTNYEEHKGLFWTLDYDRYFKGNGESYRVEQDYYGFFPNPNPSIIGEIRDLEKPQKKNLEDLVQKHDLFYLADTYGVFQNDFDLADQGSIGSDKIYGGLSQTEIDLLLMAKEEEKIIIAEYNSMASPTRRSIRSQFEQLMGLKWTGWIARYFEELDRLQNQEIPLWLIENFQEQKNQEWNLQGAGLVFIHEGGEIQIFLQNEDFTNETPLIRTQRMNKSGFNLPEIIPYPDWFDIVLIERDFQVISYFDIGPSNQGLERLREMGLPRFFPAAITRPIGKGSLYYFSGDFSDMKGNLGSAKFKGLPFLYRGLYSPSNYRNRQSFFWNYYLPLTRQILKRAYKNKS